MYGRMLFAKPRVLLHFLTGGPYELKIDGSAYHGVMLCTEFLMQAYHILASLGKLQI